MPHIIIQAGYFMSVKPPKLQIKPPIMGNGSKPGTRASETTIKVINNLIVTILVLTVLSAVLIFLGLTYIVGLIVIGLMPAVVANVVEKRNRRFASKAVSAFNLAGILPFFFKLGGTPNPNLAAKEMISDPYVWLMIYGFATFGWVLIQVLPQLTLLILLVRSEYTIKKLKNYQEELVKEWGEVIKR